MRNTRLQVGLQQKLVKADLRLAAAGPDLVADLSVLQSSEPGLAYGRAGGACCRDTFQDSREV